MNYVFYNINQSSLESMQIKLITLFLFLPFIGISQHIGSVVIVPTTETNLDSSSSYIYCATMEIMWNELNNYIGKKPKTANKISSIELLNKVISNKYQIPIEDKYVVVKTGFVKDSILDKINSELDQKFNTHWNPSHNLNQNDLVAFSFLRKDVTFYHLLNDKFYNLPFNNGNSVNVDYFGIKEGNPEQSRTDIIVHDYKTSDDFIVQMKCRDSLDEIYFAKIPLQTSLADAYQTVLKRINTNNSELFNGGDILQIPFIKFDTTTNYSEIEGTTLKNSQNDRLAFQHVSQRISFDLNQQGIKLESSAHSYLEFSDADNPPPRLLAFDKPFLIIMKRNQSDSPYFMYWVSGVEFMRSYILESHQLSEVEKTFVGRWKITEKILSDGRIETYSEFDQVYDFKSDGTFDCHRPGYEIKKGSWSFSSNVLSLDWLNSNIEADNKIELKLIDCTSDKFTIDGKTKLVFRKE